MHGLLPSQRTTAHTPGNHHTGTLGQGGAAQPAAPASARGIPAESREPSRRLGFAGESSRGSGQSSFPSASTRTAAVVPPAATPGPGGRIAAAGDVEKTNSWPARSKLKVEFFGALLKLPILGLIRFYQACLSPMMPIACRFQPSCSAYAYEAVKKWGAWTGGRLAVRRLLRCRPWSGRFGYDPVPEK
jgi:uncharacterized protein